MSIFEVTGSADPLGLWETTTQPVSFGLGDETGPETDAPIYRVTLPASDEASNAALAEQLAGLRRMNSALVEIPSRLSGLVRRTRPEASRSGAAISYALSDSPPEPGPEGELLTLLAATDLAALGAAQGLSFGINEAAGQALGRAKVKFEALLEQVNRDLLHFAWVETHIASASIARTQVRWSGASTTIWKNPTPAEHMSMHRKSLEIVSQTRHVKLRMLLTVSTGAAKTAVLLAAPGGAALALPAVYDYVSKILDQVKQLKSVSAS